MKFLALASLAVLFLTTANADDSVFMGFRTFKNKDGKELEARLLYIDDSKIEIERRDGEIFKLAVALLSDDDQLWLKEHLPAIRAAMEKPLFEFTGIDAKKTVTDHFNIYTVNTSEEPAKPYAERTWAEAAKYLPRLKSDFEQGTFNAMGEFRNKNDFDSEDGRFRIDIYLINSEKEYETMTAQHAERIEDPILRATSLRLTREVGHFEDSKGRYRVLTKAATETSAKSGSEAGLVHGLAVHLLESHSRNNDLPFWLTAGFGWFMENDFFRKCQTLYVGLQRTDAELGGVGNIKTTQGFDPEEPWARELKRLHKSGEKNSIREILSANLESMSPAVSGSVFAFVSFLIWDETHRQHFAKLVTKLRVGEEFTEDLLVSSYHYPTLEAMEEAWHAYILTSNFR